MLANLLAKIILVCVFSLLLVGDEESRGDEELPTLIAVFGEEIFCMAASNNFVVCL